MTAVEPCENCGTPVAAMDVIPQPDSGPGWKVAQLPEGLPKAHMHTVLDAVEGIGVYEGTRAEDWAHGGAHFPTVAYTWFEHTAARCRGRGQETR